jgi:hypothetical protein
MPTAQETLSTSLGPFLRLFLLLMLVVLLLVLLLVLLVLSLLSFVVLSDIFQVRKFQKIWVLEIPDDSRPSRPAEIMSPHSH